MTNPEEPAFPRDERYEGHNGLTKREMIATMAMQGICANVVNADINRVAKSAVEMADALINELNKAE